MQNGLDSGPLAGWAIALVSGATLVGKLVHTPIARLSPVYTLNVDMRAGPKPGTINVNYFCTPLLMLTSIDGVDLPGSAITIECESLSREERRRLHGAVRQAEEATAQMRASDAGVVLARSLPTEKR